MNEKKEITKILMELGTPCHLAGYDLKMLAKHKVRWNEIFATQ